MSRRTTINIPSDVMRNISHIKKTRPTASTNQILIDLARIGAEKELSISLIGAVDRVSEALDKVESSKQGENEKTGVDDVLEQYILRLLCIARRFAYSTDKELLDTAERDAVKLLQRGKDNVS